MKKIITMMLLTSIILVGCKNKKTVLTEENPFFKEWDTPFGVPPFAEIKYEHYLPAFEKGMSQQIDEIEAIVTNQEAPNFQNTIEALEYSGALLRNVSGVFFNLTECMNSSEMQEIEEKITPLMAQHEDNIALNKTLFQRIKTVYDQKETLNIAPEQMKLLEETYKGFVRGGANVPVEQQARFREINAQLAALTTKYGTNILGATNDYKLIVDDVARLDGLTPDQLVAAQEAANTEDVTKGKYVFTIHLPSMEPFLQNCKDRELRKQLWTAYSTRCTFGKYNNGPIIDSIVNLRLEKAKILGFPSHAAYKLDNSMAKTPKAVHNLLMQVWKPAIAKAKQEAAEYQKMIDLEGNHFKLEPYDWRFYTEKLRKEKYDLDDDTIRPYFSLKNVREAIFMISETLYGIQFVENKNIPTYTEGVDAYEVIEKDQVIAILYLDYHPRESKRSGAWMTNFREQYVDQQGNNVIPVISLVMNFTKPTADKPSLLNFDETETFFHEFGHALHGMLTKCHYRSLSGTNVPRDFVEFPSQFNEHFSKYPYIMEMYAKHYKTDKVIPTRLMAKIEAASTYGQGFINTELLAASLLDMEYHSITQPTKIIFPDFEDAALKKIGLIPEIISRYKSTYFQHIFSNGYDAGYYSYTWAAVLDHDAFEAFKEHGVFDEVTALSFKTNILEKGNKEDLMSLYVKFRGKQPSIDALLKNRGLK
ncbi:MAG: M3 family metallopeptidase [Bacteroidales bacterium]|jgi:peptidyl-dipeptidase Dcp|nr:M3 family metallopeptidase [Bacteroidales bacterium]